MHTYRYRIKVISISKFSDDSKVREICKYMKQLINSFSRNNLPSDLASNEKYHQTFKMFEELHSSHNFVHIFHTLLNIGHECEKFEEMCILLHHMELEVHKDNDLERFRCLKLNLTKCKKTTAFFNQLERGFLNKYLHKISPPKTVSFKMPLLIVMFILKILGQMALFYVDIVKDIILIYLLGEFLSQTTAQLTDLKKLHYIWLILVILVILPILVNTFTLLFFHDKELEDGHMTFLLLLLLPLIPAISLYIINRKMLQEKLSEKNNEDIDCKNVAHFDFLLICY